MPRQSLTLLILIWVVTALHVAAAFAADDPPPPAVPVPAARAPWPRNPPADRTSRGYAFAMADTMADLDGDRHVERVTLAVYGLWDDGRRDRAALEVGLAGLVLHGDYFLQRVLVTDIDAKDPWHEIAVCDFGPSDDPVTRFFRYTRGALEEIGSVPGFPVLDGGIDGSGVIRTTCRGQVLQTWFHPCRFGIDLFTGAIKPWNESDFPMGTRVTLRRDPPVYVQERRPETAGVIPAGTAAVIVSSDDRGWCFVRGANGVAGWFGIVGYDTVAGLGLPATEVFDGLSTAD